MIESGRKIPQDDNPRVNIPLRSVGIDGYRCPIILVFGQKRVNSIAELSLSVNLPPGMRGAHFSRILTPAISRLSNSNVDTSRLVSEISGEILENNTYSSRAQVKLSTVYMKEIKGPGEIKSFVPYTIEYSSESGREKTKHNSFGLGTTILTACPCTMEGSRAILIERYPEHSEFLKEIPTVTHNQRNRLFVTISNYKEYTPDPDEIIASIESVTGRPLSSLRTDSDSDIFVLEAHENPRFVEDVVRDVAEAICRDMKILEDSAIINVKSRSEESIHNHDAYAEIELTFGEIRKSSRNR